MKIATFNINNVNKRLANLLDWLRAAKPDVVCLQELKATDAEFPAGRDREGRLRRGLARPENVERRRHPGARCEPVVTRTALPGDPADTQSRYIEAAVNGVLVTSLYAPNGNPQPGPKFNYKLAWMERLARARRRALRGGRAGRARRRLQRRADRSRHLPDQVLREERAGAAGEPRRCSSAFSSRAGSTRSARSIRTRRCTRSGITCGTAGRAMPACGSIICC